MTLVAIRENFKRLRSNSLGAKAALKQEVSREAVIAVCFGMASVACLVFATVSYQDPSKLDVATPANSTVADEHYSGEQLALLRRMSDFSFAPYKAQYDALGSADTDGKDRVVSDCSSAMRRNIGSINVAQRWVGSVSLDRCTYEAIAKNDAYCTDTDEVSVTPNSIKVELWFDDTDSKNRRRQTIFDAGYVLPNDPIYSTLLKLRDHSHVLFTGDSITPLDGCKKRDFEDSDSIPDWQHYFDFHLQMIEAMPQ